MEHNYISIFSHTEKYLAINDLCIVVPTMSRKQNGLDYFKKTLSLNTPIFNQHTFCIYSNDTDYNQLKPEITIPHTVIPRVNHDETLSKYEKGSYEYWRAHLCADFMYCLRQATIKHPNCSYFMWLEDDVLLHPRFSSIWNNFNNFLWSHSGHGATCVIIEKQHLLHTIIPAIERLYLEGTPIDWMYGHWGQVSYLPETVAFHIGVESSREGTTRDQNDWDIYLQLKKE